MLKYLLPALIPSWRFFESIGPSPRVEYALLRPQSASPEWREFGPRPPRLSLRSMLLRLCWNPGWNEALYVVRCAERLMQGERGNLENEINRRIERHLRADLAHAHAPFMFRILAHERLGDQINVRTVFESHPTPQ